MVLSLLYLLQLHSWASWPLFAAGGAVVKMTRLTLGVKVKGQPVSRQSSCCVKQTVAGASRTNTTVSGARTQQTEKMAKKRRDRREADGLTSAQEEPKAGPDDPQVLKGKAGSPERGPQAAPNSRQRR